MVQICTCKSEYIRVKNRFKSNNFKDETELSDHTQAKKIITIAANAFNFRQMYDGGHYIGKKSFDILIEQKKKF